MMGLYRRHFMTFQVQRFGHIDLFFFVRWPHNNDLLVATISLEIFMVGIISVISLIASTNY